ncbi:protease [Cutibacterium acnes JCM 18916]|nr:protease [Cutibacterium acnes JCM 18916]
MESIGASYDGSAGLAGSHVGVDVPVTRFDAAAELFVELLNTTSLVEEDIARQIDASRASLAQTSQRGSSLARWQQHGRYGQWGHGRPCPRSVPSRR